MIKPLSRIFFISLLLASVAMTGCATTQDLDKVRADVQTAMDRAASAEAAARQAQSSADAALAAANRAEKAAQDAKAASEATDQKIDRMFKQTMNK